MKKIPLYVLTGFLGSGKTTVLKSILQSAKEKKIGVIQNEFGKVGIDGELLRKGDIEMIELNRGSIFCSCLKLSFVKALADMAKMDLDCIFVESSGLSDPSNVEEILAAAGVLCDNALELKGIICLVDGVNFYDQIGDLETVDRQLKHCNLAVITKTDLIDESKILKLEESIREINPLCPILKSSMGVFPLDFLNQDIIKYKWAENESSTNTEETKPKTISLNCYESVKEEELRAFLSLISPDVYRVKGFFLIDNEWKQLDMVGTRVDLAPCKEKAHSQIVLISKVGPVIIKKAMESWNKNIDVKMELKN